MKQAFRSILFIVGLVIMLTARPEAIAVGIGAMVMLLADIASTFGEQFGREEKE